MASSLRENTHFLSLKIHNLIRLSQYDVTFYILTFCCYREIADLISEGRDDAVHENDVAFNENVHIHP